MFIKLIGCILLFGFSTSFGLYSKGSELVIQLPDGKIRGHVVRSISNKDHYAFQEIPYASPPVGELRFKEAAHPRKWGGILDTTKNTKICCQLRRDLGPGYTDPRENEDCLYMNIFTPRLPSHNQTLLPVMVYIYGGFYEAGDASEYDMHRFVENDLVVVTFNFRSGPLGFLTTEDGVIPANLALKDQNFALKWVQRNIHLFGGDFSKVTLTGHSSGAISVGYHVISKKSKGLFRAGILQSATSMAHFSYQKDAKYIAYETGKLFSKNFTSKNSSDDLLKLLKTVPANVISKTFIWNLPSGYNCLTRDCFTVWSPVIENSSFEDAFITGPMHDDVKNGKINKVPILIGITSEEEISKRKLLGQAIPLFDQNISSLVNDYMNIKEENKIAYATELRNFYTRVPFKENTTAVYKLMSNDYFSMPIMRHADLQSKYTDVYFYVFSRYGPLVGRSNAGELEGVGKVAHCGELGYLYYYRIDPDVVEIPAEDIITRDRLITFWTNFIKYLNPTPENDPLLQNITWPKVTPNSFLYLNIDVNLSVEKNPRNYEGICRIFDKYLEDPVVSY